MMWTRYALFVITNGRSEQITWSLDAGALHAKRKMPLQLQDNLSRSKL